MKNQSKSKVFAIIQARYGSHRLRGKILKPICGQPMLWHINNRLTNCINLDGIAIATSTKKADDQVEIFAQKNHIKIFRGNEANVLGRYIQAAKYFKTDYVLRVTGDAPLIDPQEIDSLIAHGLFHQADFCIGEPDIPAVHLGFSLISLKALEKIYQVKDLNDYHKEHVTIYVRDNPSFVKTIYFTPAKIFQKSGYQLSVDTQNDFDRINQIYQKFWQKGSIVDLKKVVNYLEKHPELKT